MSSGGSAAARTVRRSRTGTEPSSRSVKRLSVTPGQAVSLLVTAAAPPALAHRRSPARGRAVESVAVRSGRHLAPWSVAGFAKRSGDDVRVLASLLRRPAHQGGRRVTAPAPPRVRPARPAAMECVVVPVARGARLPVAQPGNTTSARARRSALKLLEVFRAGSMNGLTVFAAVIFASPVLK